MTALALILILSWDCFISESKSGIETTCNLHLMEWMIEQSLLEF